MDNANANDDDDGRENDAYTEYPEYDGQATQSAERPPEDMSRQPGAFAPPPPPPPNYDGENAAGAGQFSAGAVLSRTFSVLLKNPVLFFVISAVAVIPGLLLSGEPQSDGGPGISFVVVAFVSGLLLLVVQGATAYGVFQILRGGNTTIGEAMSRGMARILTIILASIIVSIGTGIGWLLFIVPGIILTCMWFVTIPVCVVEKRGATASMSRSSELTRGYRWSIFGLILILLVITFTITLVSQFVFVVIAGPVAAGILSTIVTIIPQTFKNVMCAVIYYELRVAKEGVNVESLANVFD